ncbi:hypothetical protein GC163_24330 [bacterium]|nr:hypothetical protein [bacterium]
MTERDIEIIDALTLRVRMLTIEQVARTWWEEAKTSTALAARRLKQLEEAGKVHLFSLLAHPEIPLLHPVLAWQPRDPEPDFHGLAYCLKIRWTENVITQQAVVATAEAGRENGGWGGRMPRATEQTHDLHLAAVYLTKRRENPEAASFWESEELVRLKLKLKGKLAGDRLPDAIISRPKRTAIEFAGRYVPAKLQAFHDYCSGTGLRYELW